jgi:uncharacterized membrane protein
MATSPAILFLVAFVLIPLIDAPWLYYQSFASRDMFRAIQCGTDPAFRLGPAVVVYLALAYLLVQQTSVLGAGLAGAATYAVYDFTNLALFQKYDPLFAVQDTVWGGVLFAAAYYILDQIKKLI